MHYYQSCIILKIEKPEIESNLKIESFRYCCTCLSNWSDLTHILPLGCALLI